MKIFALFCVCAFVAMLPATPPCGHAVTYNHAAAVVTPYVQTTQVYAAQFLAVPVATYVAGYLAPAVAPAVAAPTAAVTSPVCDTSALKAEIAELKAQLRGMAPQFPSQNQPPQYQQFQPTSQPRQMPLAMSAPDADSAAIVGLINAKCIRCHSGDDAKKGFRLDSTLTVSQAAECLSQVSAGLMPPGSPLTTEEKALIKRLVVKLCSK